MNRPMSFASTLLLGSTLLACGGTAAEPGVAVISLVDLVDDLAVEIDFHVWDQIPEDVLDRALNEYVVERRDGYQIVNERTIFDPIVRIVLREPGFKASLPADLEPDLKVLMEMYDAQSLPRTGQDSGDEVPSSPAVPLRQPKT